MSKQLSLESLTKKLKNVANTQDSIPMFSLWIIHHKLHYKLIVDTWLSILKSSKTKHRLTLFYLANDVIQSCRRKKADEFREYFATVLPEAIALLRDKTISSGVERVLNVWSSRKIYDIDFIDQLHAALLTNRTPDTLRQKLLAEYKPSSLVEKIEEFKKTEDLISTDEKQLKNINVDASSTDSIHKLKDKVGGELYSKNFEESATNIERFIVQYEDLIEKRKQLIDELSQGAVFYGAQYHEAKIVVNAYQSFDDRVMKMKKLLDQVKLKFSPVIEDHVATAEEDTVADMDMSDSDQELGSKPSKIVAVDTASRRPTRTNSVPTSRIVPKTAAVNRPGMRGASTVTMFAKAPAPPSNLSIPTISNGAVKTPASAPPQSRTSTPSASPPSPEGSPELNISSPPRYPSLESRIADLFSIGPKPGAGVSAAENTASDSDGELALNARKASPTKRNAGAGVAGQEKRAETWQNSIPVIGGNRRFSKPGGSFMGDPGPQAAQDGGSTPLQDEGNSDNEKTGLKSLDSALPPPSFTGDALSFLTKFMGQQTSTELSVAASQSGPTVSTAGSHSNVLQKLDIDWSSLQNITASVGKWPEPTGPNPVSSAQNGSAATSQVTTNERDTDYRTGAGSNAISNSSSSNFAREFARQQSNDDTPRYPAANEEYVVEEEEILVEEDPRPVHLSNLKNIPTIPACQLSPPPRPPFETFPGPPGRKRPFDDPPEYGRADRFSAPPRPVVNHNRRPGFPRMQMDGPPGRRYGPGQGPRRGHGTGPRRRNPAVASALAEERYYNMLYDELRPKFPRPPFRGRSRPRRPYR